VEYAILATLWNGPANVPELVGAVYERTGRAVSPALVDSYLQLFERFGYVERTEEQHHYTLAERGSLYLAYAVTA
jgi:DNA-binding PadR family transcriptional regulator